MMTPRPVGPVAYCIPFPVYLSENGFAFPSLTMIGLYLFNCMRPSFAYLFATAACAGLTVITVSTPMAAMATMSTTEPMHKFGAFSFVNLLM